MHWAWPLCRVPTVIPCDQAHSCTHRDQAQSWIPEGPGWLFHSSIHPPLLLYQGPHGEIFSFIIGLPHSPGNLSRALLHFPICFGRARASPEMFSAVLVHSTDSALQWFLGIQNRSQLHRIQSLNP